MTSEVNFNSKVSQDVFKERTKSIKRTQLPASDIKMPPKKRARTEPSDIKQLQDIDHIQQNFQEEQKKTYSKIPPCLPRKLNFSAQKEKTPKLNPFFKIVNEMTTIDQELQPYFAQLNSTKLPDTGTREYAELIQLMRYRMDDSSH